MRFAILLGCIYIAGAIQEEPLEPTKHSAIVATFVVIGLLIMDAIEWWKRINRNDRY